MTIPPRSLRLRTLGGLSIGEGNSPTHRSRRALALLGLAAAAGADGVERDRVLALLWPESDSERANNSVRQVLFGIRRDLGAGGIIYEAGRFRLNPVIFTVDLWDFEHAIRTQDADRVAALYTGPFLDAFHVAGLGAFERWVDGERARLRQVAFTELRHAAARATLRDDHHAAVAAWRFINTIDPFSATSALGLLHSLVSAGDRSDALIFARAYEELLHAELDAAPDESVARYVASLRASKETNADGPAAPVAVPALLPIAALPAATQTSAHVAPGPARRWRTSLTRFARRPAIIAAALGLGVLIPAAARTWAGDKYSPNVVAVLPVRSYNSADSSVAIETASLLVTDLDGAGALHAISPTNAPDIPAARRRAFAQGAGLYVFGDVTSHSNSVRLSASFMDARTGATIGDRVVVEGSSDEIVRLTDDLALRLIAVRYDRPIDHLLQSAALSARSVAALKAFLHGSAALRDRHFADAADAFRDATIADSTFALAYYSLAVTHDWCGRGESADRAIGLAVRYSDDLPDRDRRLVSAYAAWRGGLNAAATETYRSIVADYPDDAAAWRQLGKALLGTALLRGPLVVEARHAFDRALMLDPSDLDALVHLERIARLDGRRRDADALKARALHLVPDAAALDAFATRALGSSRGSQR